MTTSTATTGDRRKEKPMPWPETEIARMFGIRYPILLAPMAGGYTTPELVAAVSEAGGMGGIGAAYLTGDGIRAAAGAVRQRTSSPFSVNLLMMDETPPDEAAVARVQAALKPVREELGLPDTPPPERYCVPLAEQVEAILDARPALFSFAFDMPDESVIRDMQDAGIRVMGTATTVAEARALEEAGVDLVCAQGSEAGGHRGSFLADIEESLVGTFALIPQIADAVSVPVVAAGAIMDGRGIAAALTLGAEAAQMGSAFLRCPEAGTSPVHRAAVAAARDDATALTRAFSGRYARGIANRFMVELAEVSRAFPDFPVPNELTRDIRAAAAQQGRDEFVSLWCGQAAGMARETPAAELVETLANDAGRLLAGRG
jgi:nitronate monooxygenase